MIWNTRTRNKIMTAGLICIAIGAGFVIRGWFKGLPDAPAMLTALVGSGGSWAIFNGFAVAWEKIKSKGGNNDDQKTLGKV